MWRVCRAAGRPWPVLSDDDVIDYMVMEAVAIKVGKQDQEQKDQKVRDDWKKDTSELDQYR